MIDNKKIRKDFKILTNQKKLVYLDNAATSLTPNSVLAKMNEYYLMYNSNVHRGVYAIAQEADQQYNRARQLVANFIKAKPEEVIFTSGATQGLNLLADSLGRNLKKGDNVVLTRMEHHSNLVPWQEAARRYGFELRFIELNAWHQLEPVSAEQLIDEKTKVVSIIHVSNTLGLVNPVREIIDLAKGVGAITILDSAQAVAHLPVDVRALGCDFLVFSGHKIYGPTGIGVLYGKSAILENLEPVYYGGDMVSSVTFESAKWSNVPVKFEAGTPNIAGAIGLGAAVEYIQKIGIRNIQSMEKKVISYALKEMSKIKGLNIVGQGEERVGAISFTVEGVHPHDLATLLDQRGVAIRAGHHCTMPLMKLLNVKATARVSFGIYNNRQDVDKLVAAIKFAQSVFQNK